MNEGSCVILEGLDCCDFTKYNLNYHGTKPDLTPMGPKMTPYCFRLMQSLWCPITVLNASLCVFMGCALTTIIIQAGRYFVSRVNC